MSAPPYLLRYAEEAAKVIDKLRSKKQYEAKLKKVKKAIRFLRDNGPTHPGLNSHQYKTFTGPNGEQVWQSYVENHTPGAWRIWWMYGPKPDTITILFIGEHPK